eukprot:4253611-Amphidinium_carterae.5
MTSKLWWTKMIDPADERERRTGTNGEPTEAPVEESFNSMSPWRNFVRAWEMRNHERLKTESWNEVTYIEPHPADMTELTQGAAMTPTVMLEGHWDTWAYGDLMVPESLLAMLTKDNEGHDSMPDDKKERKWHHVIKPLLNFSGLQDDTSLFVNHKLVHYLAHQKDCDQVIRQWEEYARIGSLYDGQFGITIPGRMEQYNRPARHDCKDYTCGVEAALARNLTFQLQGAIDIISTWADHTSYMEASMERLEIWNRPRKTDDIEMSSTNVGRTPFTFVRPASPTRKNEELSDSQESETNARKWKTYFRYWIRRQAQVRLMFRRTSSGEVLASRGGRSEGQATPLPSDVLDLQEEMLDKNEASPVDVLDQGEDEELVLSPTKELKVMREEDEIRFWRQMWRECDLGLLLNIEPSTTGDLFFDRKMKAIVIAKEGEYRMFDSYLIQRFPLNDQQRGVRGSGHYDPCTQLWSENLIGTLALSPQRELAWVIMRRMILNTPSPRQVEEYRMNEAMTGHDVANKTSDFYLQCNGNERDIRGIAVYDPRPSIHSQSFHDHLHDVLDNKKPSVADLQYRLVALSNNNLFQEQVVQWWHAIGEIILPKLIEKRVVDQNLSTLSLLCQGTSYMKDISHLGAIGQYGDDGSAFEEGMEQIHLTDFGNRLYASVILPDFTDMSITFTEEHKGDVLETLMGLNFLEKEHRLTCQDMGITAIDDAQEALLKVECYTFRKGLEWAMSYFHDCSVITAIVAMS